jgi:biopolymer transport protein ExbD
MRLDRRLSVKTAIDMTPLVDVILMLVMFFLITSTFKTTPGIQLALPGSSTARPMSQEPLKVLVVSEGEIHVGTAVADLRGLPEAISREVVRIDAASKAPVKDGEVPSHRAVVEGDSTISYQLLVSVLDALRGQGIASVGLATRAAGPAGAPAR